MHPGEDEPDEDVLEGHEGVERFRRLSEAWLVRLVLALAVVAAVAIGAAVHALSSSWRSSKG